ncbi:transmembrane amino acid transporter protein-domain-containing protein [Dioszegia hungarica]|uniref:Transmembrane amino acid transporter protein-domain-containing protein n=1 Tax=Dioszegia hungarica TaxID=4972 RepID=A0AA38LSZ6_9TREE|nr:transmembrane amino acid transporter protein-domain-containing protein [Dioszegia hungarica]KAI9631891.1 transmembrane amino acid transporter protein-domain-containing protein [Dioszegia hungarica]
MSDYKAKDAEAGTQTYVQPIAGSGEATPPNEKVMQGEDEFEVFKRIEGAEDYRTVTWWKAAFIFLKVIFATGVLSIPSSMVTLGAVPGAIMIAVGLGRFREKHAGCHTVADMAHHVWGAWFRELVGALYLIAYVLCAGTGVIGSSIALNSLSDHATCTVVFSVVCTVIIAIMASFPKFHQIGWLTWAGFFSIFIAVFIVVVGVTTYDRPYAAPAGVTDIGFYAITPVAPAFAAGVAACVTIFVSSAGTSAFIPVISEMKRPQDYRKALYTCMGFVTAVYLAFALVVYKWCGRYVASPSLGSAGPTLEKVAYGVGLLGLLASGMIYVHVGAKYLFVRLLRDSRHLQEKTVQHWVIWLSCSIGLSLLAFVLASAIPIFNYLVALVGSICFCPLALMFPAILHFYDNWNDIKTGSVMQKAEWVLNMILLVLGAFLCVSGTYGVILLIQQAYASGAIGGAFSCADNAV